MATLHHLELGLIDLQDRMQRELQFSSDSKAQIATAMATVREAIDALDHTICTALDERMRALSAAVGSGNPSPETLNHVDAPKPARRLREVGADA